MKKLGVDSVFRRLFLRFVGIILLVFLVIAILLYQYVSAQRELAVSAQMNHVTGAAASVEQNIRAVISAERELFTDQRMKKLAMGAYLDNYERAELILEIQSDIVQTRLVNTFIQDVIVTFPTEGVEISAVNGYQKRQYTPEQFVEERAFLRNPVNLRDGALCTAMISPLLFSLEEGAMPDYEIKMVLSEAYLQGMLAAMDDLTYAGAFWVYHSDGKTEGLYSDSDIQFLPMWQEGWEQSGCPEEYQKLVYSKADGRQFVSRTIPAYDLTLVAWQDNSTFGWRLLPTLMNIGAVVLAMGILMGLLVLWANRSISKPIYKIMDAFQSVQAGNLEIRIYHEQNDEFSYIYDDFNKTIEKISELLNNIKEQEVLLRKAEQIQLQSQINPHFLYNSFYNIKFMAQNEDYEQIEAAVTALAKYYRFLNKETEATVTLGDEAAHMHSYIAVQQMRFGDKISVDIQPVPEAAAAFRVPKLILQPIVENAYNYGLKNVTSDGWLSIRYALNGDWLDVIIEDNGGSITPEKLAAMDEQMHQYSGDAINHALTNVHRRLLLAFGEGSGITLSAGDAQGLRVTLRMNLRTTIT